MSALDPSRVSVLVVGYGSPEWLDRCLTTVAEVLPPEVQVVVVCEAEEPGTRLALAGWVMGRLHDRPVLTSAPGEVTGATDDTVRIVADDPGRTGRQAPQQVAVARGGRRLVVRCCGGRHGRGMVPVPTAGSAHREVRSTPRGSVNVGYLRGLDGFSRT